MVSSDDALRGLGSYLSGTEARQVATRLKDGDPLGTALGAVDAARRSEARALVQGAELDTDALIAVLRAIQGAKSTSSTVESVWTLPGNLAKASPLTGSSIALVQSARASVVCSTYNFERTSGMWQALHDAARRPGIRVTVYVDHDAAGPAAKRPTLDEIASWLHPAEVFATATIGESHIRNHAKFMVIDHRFVVVTSANYSWSGENRNVELGLRLDDQPLAEAIEEQLRAVRPVLYARVLP